jgi:Asp/Glu/hydantoin racemase
MADSFDPAVEASYVEAARHLQAEGCRGLIGGCGFVSRYHRSIADAVNIPVVSSSLQQVPLAASMLAGGRAVGIVTAHGGKLSDAHFIASGWSPADVQIRVIGLEAFPSFQDRPRDVTTLVREQSKAMVHVVERLLRDSPEVGALVFECTNLGPYAKSVQAACGIPVFDITTAARLLGEVVARRAF